MWRSAGTVPRVLALRHDSFEPHLAGMKEDRGAVLSEVLIETQPRRRSREQALQRCLAYIERLAPQIIPIDLNQVKSV